jgi:hypothetical protein
MAQEEEEEEEASAISCVVPVTLWKNLYAENIVLCLVYSKSIPLGSPCERMYIPCPRNF